MHQIKRTFTYTATTKYHWPKDLNLKEFLQASFHILNFIRNYEQIEGNLNRIIINNTNTSLDTLVEDEKKQAQIIFSAEYPFKTHTTHGKIKTVEFNESNPYGLFSSLSFFASGIALISSQEQENSFVLPLLLSPPLTYTWLRKRRKNQIKGIGLEISIIEKKINGRLANLLKNLEDYQIP